MVENPRREVFVPAAYGAAVEVSAGEHLSIIDLEGSQVADFVAIPRDAPRRFLSPHQTRSTLRRWTLRPGDRLVNNNREPVFEIVQDDVGVHEGHQALERAAFTADPGEPMSQDPTPKVGLELALHEDVQAGALGIRGCVGPEGWQVRFDGPVEHSLLGLTALVGGRRRGAPGHGLLGEPAPFEDECSQDRAAATVTWRSGGGQECGRGVGEGMRGR